jgi:hypothetical protein
VSTAQSPRWWPQSLASRIALILVTGLILSNALTFGAILYERYQVATDMMMGNLERDIASSVALLDRLPAAERPEWLPRLARRYYDFNLEAAPLRTSGPAPEGLSERLAESIEKAIGTRYPVKAFMAGKGSDDRLAPNAGHADIAVVAPSIGWPAACDGGMLLVCRAPGNPAARTAGARGR